MALKSLTYTSWARPGITTEEVEAILATARANNAQEELTGILIFNGTSFMQILEGEPPVVDSMVKRLRGDRRHSNMSIRDDREIDERLFTDWSMAYLKLENGAFEGEQEVRRVLERDVPQSVRNVIDGVTRAVRRL